VYGTVPVTLHGDHILLLKIMKRKKKETDKEIADQYNSRKLATP